MQKILIRSESRLIFSLRTRPYQMPPQLKQGLRSKINLGSLLIDLLFPPSFAPPPGTSPIFGGFRP